MNILQSKRRQKHAFLVYPISGKIQISVSAVSIDVFLRKYLVYERKFTKKQHLVCRRRRMRKLFQRNQKSWD